MYTLNTKLSHNLWGCIRAVTRGRIDKKTRLPDYAFIL